MKKRFVTVSWLLLLTPLFLVAQSSVEPTINTVLNGVIIDGKSKLPLEGAVVGIKGTTHVVVASKEGKFNFKTGQIFPYTLVITHIGYESIEINVTESPIQIVLKEIPKELDEVVVVGYGTQKRKNLIGSVSKVNPAETRSIPAGSFDAQLQGKAAGVQISSSTGVPGEAVNVRLRGATSINADNNPLYVVDGVFINSSSLQTIGTGGKSTSPIADINPSDIESIEILKDAEASALYGSRGANGVVIVTTKERQFQPNG